MTYDIGRKAGLTSPYPHLRQIVLSSSITAPPDPAVEVFGPEVISEVRALKAGPGKDLWLAGGGRLAAFLADEIDELILKVNPVLLGAGTPLFDAPHRPAAGDADTSQGVFQRVRAHALPLATPGRWPASPAVIAQFTSDQTGGITCLAGPWPKPEPVRQRDLRVLRDRPTDACHSHGVLTPTRDPGLPGIGPIG